MQIERTEEEIIIRLPASIDNEILQKLTDYLGYLKTTQHSQASQYEVDTLAREVKKGW